MEPGMAVFAGVGWAVIGAIVGYVAAERRGFSPAVGVLGGLLLGLLSPLMFLCNSAAGSPACVKCPYCAEWVKGEALICRFCQRPLRPARPAPAAPRQVRR